MCSDNEMKEDYSASEREVRKMKTLNFYCDYLSYENGNNHMTRFSITMKEDCDELMPNPRLWKRLNEHHKATLQHCFDFPLPGKDDFTSSSSEFDDSDYFCDPTQHENDLTTTIEQESSSSSFETSQENSFIASSESNDEIQPTLNSIFHNVIDSNDDSPEQRVNNHLTSSEKTCHKIVTS